MAEIGGTAVATKVVDSLYVVAKKEIGYMWNCKKHVEKLKNEVESLKVMKRQTEQNINIAVSKGDNLIEGVKEWLEKAEDEISKAQEFLEQEANAKKTCFKIGMCGNWGNLHRYGKKTVTEKTPAVLELRERGKTYEGGVSVYTPVPTQLDVYENKNLEDLVTHNSALMAIIAGLEDETKQIIGIYGLGGVGKTTLAKEVVAKVKHTLFVDVAFTTISQTVNPEKIQKDLENATKRIMKGDKILIILDDVWEKLNLEDLCIPCGVKHKNCNILLTSRSQDVCDKMNADGKICVNSLRAEEVWILFKRVVGEKVETDVYLKPFAMKVAEECGGLPLLIQVVGNALKHKNIDIWKLALSQLKKHAPAKLDPDIRKAFIHLKLSYDYLESEEAKACFLLCSLFPEDDNIALEDLVFYSVGLEKFNDLDSIEDARERVQNAVNILTSSCLLLNVEDDKISRTKMHDVVRDVALLIASQGNNKYMVKSGSSLTEWLPRDTSLESYSGISLMCNQIIKLPDYKVNVPHLEIFLVDVNDDLTMISDEFIGCMKSIKVLDISWNNISSLPQSFQLLTKLRTLDLRGNKSLVEISILKELKDLEILILNRTGITEIPKEIAQLVNLRVLYVKDCEDLTRITQGVISALSRLEELSIDFKLNFEGASDCLAEVMSMSKLRYLDLTIPCIDEDIPTQGFTSEKLKGFVIQIGEYCRSYELKFHNMSRSGCYLVLSKVHLGNSFVNFLKKVIEESRPHIFLRNIENLNNIMPTMYDEGFSKLEHIKVISCPNVSCLVDEGESSEKFFKGLKDLKLIDLYKLEVIWKCPDENICLTNLVRLRISECMKLGRVLTVSVAQGLVNLKEMAIDGCKGLEEVIWGKGGGGDDKSRNIIVFPSLTNIFLCDLPSLKRFFNSDGVVNENCSIIIKYPSLVDVEILYCKSMEIWGPGIHETPNLKTLVWNGDVPKVLNGPCAINEAAAEVYEDFKNREQSEDEEDEEDLEENTNDEE